MDTIFSFSLAQNLLPFCHLTCENVVVVHFHPTTGRMQLSTVVDRAGNIHHIHTMWRSIRDEMDTQMKQRWPHIYRISNFTSSRGDIFDVCSHIKNEFRQSRVNSAINDCPIAIAGKGERDRWNEIDQRLNETEEKRKATTAAVSSLHSSNTHELYFYNFVSRSRSLSPSVFISPIDFN